MRLRMSNPVHLLAGGFGTGLAPRAPGTFGTVAGVAVYLLMSGLPVLVYIIVTAALFLAGIWICGRAAADLGEHDHGSIVFDEIVGYLVTMIAVPATPIWIIAGFALFRLFDILKPWPIRLLDRRVHGGFGIMLDDLVAGLIGLACLSAAAHLL